MNIFDKYIEIKGNSRNIKYFKDLGYELGVGDIIKIDPIHLMSGSVLKVNVICDICKCVKEVTP